VAFKLLESVGFFEIEKLQRVNLRGPLVEIKRIKFYELSFIQEIDRLPKVGMPWTKAKK